MPDPAPDPVAASPVGLSDRLEYAGLRLVDALLRPLSLDRASTLMGWIWRRLAPLNARHRRADGNLARAMPELSAAERQRILDAMWDNLGRVAAETLRLPALVREPGRIALSDPEGLVDRMERTGTGAVFVSLHMGNWEVVAWPATARGIPMAATYQPLRNVLSEAFLRRRRMPLYADLVPRSRVAPLRLRRMTARGGGVAILADLRDRTGITLPFFGQPAKATVTPALLACRLGVPLFAARCVRTAGVHFRVEVTAIEEVRSGDARADAVRLTEAVHRRFESWIRDTPEQWMWAHRKWRVPASGAA